MTMPANRLFISIAIFCAALMSQAARAEQLLLTVSIKDLLSTQLPDVDQQALVEKISALRSQLIQRKQALLQIVEDSDLDGRDAILSAILPGGLIYAGFKKARHEQAQDELAQVNADIQEYSSDILAMQPAPSPVALAPLP
jgi:hypothetical protein